MKLLAEDLKKIVPYGRGDILQHVAENSNLLERFHIDTNLRVCHFLAQIMHESAGFRTTREYASGAAYEGRRGLGNVYPGDGKRFRGRGLIQVTGRHNARAFTKWMREHEELLDGLEVPDFEATPQVMEKFPWALLGAVWYWDTRKLNRYADQNKIKTITKRINGGYNGLRDRKHYFNKLWYMYRDRIKED